LNWFIIGKVIEKNKKSKLFETRHGVEIVTEGKNEDKKPKARPRRRKSGEDLEWLERKVQDRCQCGV